MKSISKILVIFMTAVTAGCWAIAITSRVFEIYDYSIFNVCYSSSTSSSEIRLKGMSRHSAMGVYKIETLQIDKTLRVIAHGALVNKYNPEEVKGELDYKLSIPHSVDMITFGNENTIILDRRNDYPSDRAWKYGEEVKK
ncbi:hypothetical protein AGMMS49545_21700 [Betaproteobacteria bacterium]|nr:hypothetical protein AGMMS49545_21700 [Betaproteobacteria bacterium]GHU47688.1 hypothetical protein AGMMS50289_23240 [Betaproteobacteria bacterium]